MAGMDPQLTLSVQTLTANAGLVVLASHGLEWLKDSRRVPQFDQYSDQLNKSFSALVAVLSAVGLQLSFTTSGDSGTLALAGLPTTGAAAFQLLLHASANYGAVKAYYHAAVKANARP